MRKRRKRGRKTTLFEKVMPIIVIVAAVVWILVSNNQWQLLNEISIILLPCIAAALIFAGIRWYIRYAKRQKYLRSDMQKIDRMTGKEFEEYLQAHFRRNGYHAELTPDSNDYGADLILTREGEITIVQAKKRYKQLIGVSAVQEIVAAMRFYNADRCIVITNSYFSNNAQTLATVNDVELWDRTMLIETFTGEKADSAAPWQGLR